MSVIRANHRPVARQSARPSSRAGMRPAVQALAIGGAFVLGIVIALSLPGTARGAEPPLGADDWYLASHAGELSVDAIEGVLVNDVGTALTAELWTEPTFGSVLLAADGGFVYTRTEPARADTFAYLATDVDGVPTEPVSVRIRFANDLPDCGTVRLPDQSQGSVIEADLAAACTDPDGDPITFSYQNPDVPDGSIWEADAQGHVRFVPPPDWVGTATVLFAASDGYGTSPVTVFAVEILPAD
jgi:hypothetical protein